MFIEFFNYDNEYQMVRKKDIKMIYAKNFDKENRYFMHVNFLEQSISILNQMEFEDIVKAIERG